MENKATRESGQYWTKTIMGWAVRDYDAERKTWTGKSIMGELSDAVFDEISPAPITRTQTAERKRNGYCNADCPESEFGNCCHPSDCQFVEEPGEIPLKKDPVKLVSMLEDVVTVLDLSESMIEQHGPLGTAPAELVRIVLERKDLEIDALKSRMVDVSEKRQKFKALISDKPSDFLDKLAALEMREAAESILEKHYASHKKRIAFPENVINAMLDFAQSLPISRGQENGQSLPGTFTKEDFKSAVIEAYVTAEEKVSGVTYNSEEKADAKADAEEWFNQKHGE